MKIEDNVKQVGGTHYGTGYGHWDYCKAAKTPYFEGNATKYLVRWRDKGGLQDLHKAKSYLEKLMAGMSTGTVNSGTRANNYLGELEDVFIQNRVGPAERLIISSILSWYRYSDLVWAMSQLVEFIEIEEQRAAEPTSAYIDQGR